MPYDSIDRIPEKSSATFRTTLVDGAGTAIDRGDISSIKLTLASLDDYTSGAPTIINSRNATEVKNANGGVMVLAGAFSWAMTAADNAMSDASRAVEIHLLTLAVTYNSGAAQSVSRHLLLVENGQSTT